MSVPTALGDDGKGYNVTVLPTIIKNGTTVTDASGNNYNYINGLVNSLELKNYQFNTYNLQTIFNNNKTVASLALYWGAVKNVVSPYLYPINVLGGNNVSNINTSRNIFAILHDISGNVYPNLNGRHKSLNADSNGNPNTDMSYNLIESAQYLQSININYANLIQCAIDTSSTWLTKYVQDVSPYFNNIYNYNTQSDFYNYLTKFQFTDTLNKLNIPKVTEITPFSNSGTAITCEHIVDTLVKGSSGLLPGIRPNPNDVKLYESLVKEFDFGIQTKAHASNIHLGFKNYTNANKKDIALNKDQLVSLWNSVAASSVGPYANLPLNDPKTKAFNELYNVFQTTFTGYSDYERVVSKYMLIKVPASMLPGENQLDEFIWTHPNFAIKHNTINDSSYNNLIFDYAHPKDSSLNFYYFDSRVGSGSTPPYSYPATPYVFTNIGASSDPCGNLLTDVSGGNYDLLNSTRVKNVLTNNFKLNPSNLDFVTLYQSAFSTDLSTNNNMYVLEKMDGNTNDLTSARNIVKFVELFGLNAFFNFDGFKKVTNTRRFNFFSLSDGSGNPTGTSTYPFLTDASAVLLKSPNYIADILILNSICVHNSSATTPEALSTLFNRSTTMITNITEYVTLFNKDGQKHLYKYLHKTNNVPSIILQEIRLNLTPINIIEILVNDMNLSDTATTKITFSDTNPITYNKLTKALEYNFSQNMLFNEQIYNLISTIRRHNPPSKFITDILTDSNVTSDKELACVLILLRLVSFLPSGVVKNLDGTLTVDSQHDNQFGILSHLKEQGFLSWTNITVCRPHWERVGTSNAYENQGYSQVISEDVLNALGFSPNMTSDLI
jgi:hypothetical protein